MAMLSRRIIPRCAHTLTYKHLDVVLLAKIKYCIGRIGHYSIKWKVRDVLTEQCYKQHKYENEKFKA